MMGWYYCASTDEHWSGPFADREAAIQGGRADHADGVSFQIAEGEPEGPWPQLFSDANDLGEFIDGTHEDKTYEDGFCAEAGLTNTDLAPLVDQINAVWTDFITKHRPTSNRLDLRPAETIPATEDWLTPNKEGPSDGR